MNYSLFQVINSWAGHSTILDDFMKAYTNGVLYLFVLILLIVWFADARKIRSENNQRMALRAVFSGVLALIISTVIHKVYHHNRPFVDHPGQIHQLVKHVADSSFPSDHATFTFAVAFAILMLNRRFGITLIVLAIITAISRVYVGVHYPFDVIAGCIVGLISAWIIAGLNGVLDPIYNLLLRIYGGIASKIPFLPTPVSSTENHEVGNKSI